MRRAAVSGRTRRSFGEPGNLRLCGVERGTARSRRPRRNNTRPASRRRASSASRRNSSIRRNRRVGEEVDAAVGGGVLHAPEDCRRFVDALRHGVSCLSAARSPARRRESRADSSAVGDAYRDLLAADEKVDEADRAADRDCAAENIRDGDVRAVERSTASRSASTQATSHCSTFQNRPARSPRPPRPRRLDRGVGGAARPQPKPHAPSRMSAGASGSGATKNRHKATKTSPIAAGSTRCGGPEMADREVANRKASAKDGEGGIPLLRSRGRSARQRLAGDLENRPWSRPARRPAEIGAKDRWFRASASPKPSSLAPVARRRLA